jgi:hypothetical protein
MILKSPVSRLALVNLFADFILNKIPKEEESIIQVIDCFNFYVIKGKTTYCTPFNIGELRDEFAIKFAEWCIESEGKEYNKYKYRNRKELLEIYKKEKGL